MRGQKKSITHTWIISYGREACRMYSTHRANLSMHPQHHQSSAVNELEPETKRKETEKNKYVFLAHKNGHQSVIRADGCQSEQSVEENKQITPED